jgi:multidrug resistance efflux pump
VAPFDGYIAEALVRPGDRLDAGGVLGRLDDRDLKLQESDLEGKLAEMQRQTDEALGQRDIAKVNIFSARRDQAQAELSMVQYNLKRTVLTTPYDAFVVSGDKTQSVGAPVRRGEVLFEVSPLTGFRVDLDVPQTEFSGLAPEQDGRVVLSSLSSHEYALKTIRLSPVAVQRDGKTVFRVEASLVDGDDLVRPGMQGLARVTVGRRPIWWIWTHPVWDWLRLKTWEWLP